MIANCLLLFTVKSIYLFLIIFKLFLNYFKIILKLFFVYFLFFYILRRLRQYLMSYATGSDVNCRFHLPLAGNAVFSFLLYFYRRQLLSMDCS